MGSTPARHAAAPGLDEDAQQLAAAVDAMPIADVVALFRKPEATTSRWLGLLVEMDVESGRELRGLHGTAAVWAGVLNSAPLFKSLLEQLLMEPQRFLEIDNDSLSPCQTAAPSPLTPQR